MSASIPSSWRSELARLEPLDLPLVATGAESPHSPGEKKAPADLRNGHRLTGWTTAKHSVADIQGACDAVISVGTRTGADAHGLLVFDIDGETGHDWLTARGLDPAAVSTWQIHRDTDPKRYKIAFQLTEQQQQQLGQIKTKVVTKPPVKDDAGNVIAKGEAVELFHGTGQVIVLGQHHKSNGNYFWPVGMGPEDLSPIPENWWQAVLEISSATTTTATCTRNNSTKSSSRDWLSLNPCPICGRNTSDYCSQHKDGKTIRCFHGSTFAPPTGLKAGELHTDRRGTIWAYSKTEPQSNGDVFSTFVEPDPEKQLSRKKQATASTKPAKERPEKTEKPRKPTKPKKHKKLSHTSAMKCFDRCVYIQCKKERNNFRRKVRLLKAVKDLGLASFINRVEIAERVLEAKQRASDGGFKALTAADRASMEKPVIHWLLPGLIPAIDLTIIGGRPKVGKTRLAVAIAAAVLKGESLFDLPKPAKAAPVVLITDDQSDGDTASMLEALELWDHPNLIWSRKFRISETDLDALLETIKANPGALVIIDSLRSISRSMQKGENDPEIGAVLYDLKQAVIDAGGTQLLIHHCNKEADLVGVEALSGHNAIGGAANTILTMHYLQGKNNRLNKSIPERQLFREARSGDGFDLVITRDGNSFRSLGSMDEHIEKAQEQEQLSKLSSLQQQVLELVPGEWINRRQVCDELEIEWGDRGRGSAAQQVFRALCRLVEIGKIESVRAGTESTYRKSVSYGYKNKQDIDDSDAN